MAEREKPVNWAEWKAQHRWPRLSSPEWALEWLVYWCKGLAIFEVLEFAGRASVLIAVILWFWEAGDREKQKHYRAWELINSARDLPGDGGRRAALQDLNEDGEALVAAPLAKAYLDGVKLSKANLSKADLSGANLTRANLILANLTKADLDRANLILANLSGANLTKADLTGANLTKADLTEANLTGANLTKADLDRANLTGADLTEADLENAKLICQTTMPDGTLNNRDCPPEPSPPASSETPPAPN